MTAGIMRLFIFDLDGTLADDSHRWHHVERSNDWDAYYAAASADRPIEHICAIARSLVASGFKLAIVTGRSESIRTETEQWLIEQGILYDRLIMRKKGDRRRNSELKVAALHALRAEGYMPLMAFEDLEPAVQAWRTAGLPCAQVKMTGPEVQHP